MIAVGLGLLAVALGTQFVGWMAVPVVGLVMGLARPDQTPVLSGAGAGALGWGVLLLWGLTRGPVMSLAQILGGIFGGLPGFAMVLMTVLFSALLAGAAAGMGSAVRAMGADGA